MKTIKQFFIWLFADFAFYLYELAEIKFTLHNGAPPKPKKKNSNAHQLYIITTIADKNKIPNQVSYGSDLYNLYKVVDGFSMYVLNGYERYIKPKQ